MAEPAGRARSTQGSRLGTALTLLRVSSLYVTFALLKHIIPLRTLARMAWSDTRRQDPQARARSLAGVVTIARVAGAPSGDCLQRALVLYRELSRAGSRPVLIAGLRQTGGRTAGHAWVEVDGVPVGEAAADLLAFSRVVCFGDRGRRLPAGTAPGDRTADAGGQPTARD